MPDTLIRNGTVVTATVTTLADVLIEGERITEVRAGISAPAGATVIDATGMYVMPGGIDAHTHLDMPFGGTTSSDDFETGTRAAAFGGTTTIVDFAIQARGTHHVGARAARVHDPRALKSRSIAGQATGDHHVIRENDIETAHQFAAVDIQAIRQQDHRAQGWILKLTSDGFAGRERFVLGAHAGRGGGHAGPVFEAHDGD